MPANLAFCYDVVSPFAHLAFAALAAHPTVPLTLRPVFLGGIMAATGNTPPRDDAAQGCVYDARLPACRGLSVSGAVCGRGRAGGGSNECGRRAGLLWGLGHLGVQILLK